MKLIAELADRRHEIIIEEKDGKVFAEIDGRKYEIESSEPEPNVFLLKHQNKIHKIYAAPNGIVNTGKNQFEINITDPKRLQNTGAGDASPDGISEIKTAMPGKIVRILAEKGTLVSKGDGVIVVEAMKMQNEMKSPKDGTISEIRFAEGASVNAGDVLAVIE